MTDRHSDRAFDSPPSASDAPFDRPWDGPSDRPGPTVRLRVRELRGPGSDPGADHGSEPGSTPGSGWDAIDREDQVVTEEPLELRLGWPGRRPESLVVTMRTPGSDLELAAGLLYAEGIVRRPEELRTIGYCRAPTIGPEQRYNVVSVELADVPEPGVVSGLERYAPVNSACGVCGKQSLDDLVLRGASPLTGPGPGLDATSVGELPERLRAAQRLFGRTGGLHAAGLFARTAPGGELTALCVREDVGRHNAVDKTVGWALTVGPLAGSRDGLAETALVVSGRAGYEIVQKALMARIPLVVAVGAPSSLAVDLARRFGITLIGFTRRHRCVVYAEGPAAVSPGRSGTVNVTR